MTYIGMFYKNTIVTINSESLVYDILTFIGTVGGSLGLFLGFSFYNGFLILEKLTCKKLEDNKTSYSAKDSNGPVENAHLNGENDKQY